MVACLAVLVQMSVEWTPYLLSIGGLSASLPVTPTPVGAIGSLLILFGVPRYQYYARDHRPTAGNVVALPTTIRLPYAGM